ncbi:hypothetical protein [Endozoicomonas sp. YOMI1]|uniref:hypothetical protein n=1 Tax=Endozoicomonas sp. YOMI1 TaxID=2828739 RepID=UPI0021475712|nr:hypothetical protein [Endozoicomonas sp. YOMI1]
MDKYGWTSRKVWRKLTTEPLKQETGWMPIIDINETTEAFNSAELSGEYHEHRLLVFL